MMAGCSRETPAAIGTSTSDERAKAGHAGRNLADDLVADRKEQEAAKHAERSQRDDQRRQLEARDKEGVDHAQPQADQGREDEHDPERRLRHKDVEQAHRRVLGEDGHRRKGDVDAAGDDDKQDAHGKNAHDDAAAQQVKQAAYGEKDRVDNADIGAQDHDRDGQDRFRAAKNGAAHRRLPQSWGVSLYTVRPTV